MSLRVAQVHKDNKVVQELPITALKKIAIGRREDADWVAMYICMYLVVALDKSGSTLTNNRTQIIEHPSGSRQHATIELNTTGLFVTDLGSAHGTCKNGEKIPGTHPHLPTSKRMCAEKIQGLCVFSV